MSWSLAELTDADRSALTALSEAVVIPENETFIVAGEHPRALLLLREGTASVQTLRHGRMVEVSRVEPGALLGEMSLVSGDPASATVVAVTACCLSRVSVALLQEYGERNPGFSARLYQGLARVIGDRLRRMNTALAERKDQEGFIAVSWADTLASLWAIELPPLVLEWVERYSAVGHRGMFLWKWCWRGLEETELTSIPPEWREQTRCTKLLAIILNVLLDDLADRPGQEARFQQAVSLLTPHPQSDCRVADLADPYLTLVAELWGYIGIRVQGLPGWEHYAPLWDFDYRQVFTAMRYASLTNLYPGMDNLAENRAYLPHNVNLMPFVLLDLMASESDPAELGRVREVVYHAQNWGQIGNMLATWRREVPDRDFTSGVFALALDTGLLSRPELASLTPDEILARIEASPVEELLMSECRVHRNRMLTVASRCHSIDLHTYTRGIETFFGMNLAARGYI